MTEGKRDAQKIVGEESTFIWGGGSVGDYALVKSCNNRFYVVSLKDSPYLGDAVILCRDPCWIDLELTAEWCRDQERKGHCVTRGDFGED